MVTLIILYLIGREPNFQAQEEQEVNELIGNSVDVLIDYLNQNELLHKLFFQEIFPDTTSGGIAARSAYYSELIEAFGERLILFIETNKDPLNGIMMSGAIEGEVRTSEQLIERVCGHFRALKALDATSQVRAFFGSLVKFLLYRKTSGIFAKFEGYVRLLAEGNGLQFSEEIGRDFHSSSGLNVLA